MGYFQRVMSNWNWPGARWWRCDFHTHSPASHDFSDRSATPEAWVSAFVQRGIHMVAMTDHNTPAWVDRLKAAVASSGAAFTFLPGVELTTAEGFHLLLLHHPEKSQASVHSLLNSCGVAESDFGANEAVSTCSVIQVLEIAAGAGAICIPAHADRPRGILERGDGPAQRQIIDSSALHAVEVVRPDEAQLRLLRAEGRESWRKRRPLTQVTFSDAHRLQDLGATFSWIKLTKPDFEGLKLALADGPQSVDRETGTDPNELHAHEVIEQIEIAKTMYVGRVQPFELRFNPWLNAIIGGRGSGKSTIVEMLRIALRRDNDLPPALAEEFRRKKSVADSRDRAGLLLPDASVRLVYRKEDQRFRIQWAQDATLTPIQQEISPGHWQDIPGDINRHYPVRIYSQGQIFELARSPDALLRLIDEAPEIDRHEWNQRWEEELRRYLAQKAHARQVASTLAEEPRLLGDLAEVKRKLAVFEASGHAETLKTFQLRRRQARAVELWSEWRQRAPDRLKKLAQDLAPSQLDVTSFADESSNEIVALAKTFEQQLRALRDRMEGLAGEAGELARRWDDALSKSAWTKDVEDAQSAYEALVANLSKVGASDPSEYGRFVQQRQLLEGRIAELASRRDSLKQIEAEAAASVERLFSLRRELTKKRADLLETLTAGSKRIRIGVLPYGVGGTDTPDLEKALREQIGLGERGQFGEDTASRVSRLRLPEITNAEQFERALDELKRELTAKEGKAKDARFRSHLSKQSDEVFDRLLVWFPEDSLKVQHSPDGDGRRFRDIGQASPGQQTAALLSFVLSHGTEPVVLDQPEDDLDNELIYGLLTQQIVDAKRTRQVIVVTHNPNIVVNGDAECVTALEMRAGQTQVKQGGLQETGIRKMICDVMEGGADALERRFRRLGGRYDGV